MNTGNNLRFKRTAQSIQKALLALLERKRGRRVSVREICEEARVNRSTFYAHYDSVPDLMRRAEDAIYEELVKEYRTKGIDERNILSPQYISHFLAHIKRYQHFYRSFLDRARSFPLERGFEPLLDEVIRPACRRAGILEEAEVMYYFVYFEAGFTMMLKHWVEHDCPESPEKLARILSKFMLDPARDGDPPAPS